MLHTEDRYLDHVVVNGQIWYICLCPICVKRCYNCYRVMPDWLHLRQSLKHWFNGGLGALVSTSTVKNASQMGRSGMHWHELLYSIEMVMSITVAEKSVGIRMPTEYARSLHTLLSIRWNCLFRCKLVASVTFPSTDPLLPATLYSILIRNCL